MDTSLDVFRAFPNAVVSGVWQIGECQRGTLVGAGFVKSGDLDVIIDEGDNTSINFAPNAEPLNADLLLYVKPEQLPTTNPRALASGYIVYDSENGDYFAIIKADVGRNQEAGAVEHVELYLQQTEVAE